MSGNVAITGVPTTAGADGSVPLRREIRDLQSNSPDLFNLYLLALRAYQAQDEEQLTSYYQIAGIHGMPYKPWDNVQGISDWDFGGYCTHSSVLFVPWHRPYLALFEQCLYAVVQGIASKFPADMRSRYVSAAKSFRLPYWDWAAKPAPSTSAFPTSISSAKITVVDVDGKTKQIDNPLYQYDFHPVNPEAGDFSDDWSQYPTTVRYPTSEGASQDAKVTRVIANENASLRSNVSLLLLSYKDFDAFSNNQWASGQSTGSFGSLEDVHNEIHDKTGGGGHMSALDTSAFDPLFWLHHVNVDRLWAIWQDLNPSSFITPKPAPTSTFSTEQGTIESESSPLTPFWNTSGTKFWVASQVKNSKTFGYAYPETQSWKYSSTRAYQAALRQSVTQLYGSNVFQNFVQTIAPQPQAVTQEQTPISINKLVEDKHKQAPVVGITAVEPEKKVEAPKPASNLGDKKADDTGKESKEAPEAIPSSLAHLAPNNSYTEWIVNIRALKHGLGQTFRVLVFIGNISSDPADWDLEYNCVGRVTVLGRGPATRCGKCQSDKDSNLVVTGTVPLTSALLQDIAAERLHSLEPDEVVPYLTANLKWRVTVFSGDEKSAEEVPGLKVSVVSTKATIGEDGIPIYSGEYTVHREITDGKPAGIGPHDEL